MNLVKLFFIFILTANVSFAKNIKFTCEEFPPDKVLAILVDVSEPLDVPNKMSYNKVSERILGEITPKTRLDIYQISGNSSGISSPIFSGCLPYSTSITSGEKYWNKKQNKLFYAPAKDALDKLGEPLAPGETSPILESIFTISIKSFTSGGKGKSLPGKIVVISDFMQHSQLLSFYREAPRYKDWKATVKGRSWSRRFDEVQAEYIVIPRDGPSKLPIAGRDFFLSYGIENFGQLPPWRDLATSITPPK